MIRLVQYPALIAVLVMASAAVRAADRPPKPTELIESVEKRLVQLDVGAEGDPDAIRRLTAKDFTLTVGGHEVQGLIVDRFCGDAPPAPPSGPQDDRPPGASSAPVAPRITRPRASFLFFFDQPHLTMAGRESALETTRGLIDRLVIEGARASIVSNARRLETIVPLTENREKLHAGLAKLRADPTHWDSYAATEEGRAANSERCGIARSYAREEWSEARRSTQRLGIAVGTLVEAAIPRALIYFGDSLREKAGLHFLQLACEPASPEVVSAEMTPSAAAEFNAVIHQALALGVHFFTIQAEGLVNYRNDWDRNRHRHAQDALVGLALETGGEAFLGGAALEFIGGRIAARTSCALLLSFPPGELPRDKPLGLTVELHVPNVKIRTPGRIVVPSPAAFEQARLLAAFVDPASSNDGSLRALLIPRGGDGSVWKTALQLRLRPIGLPNSSAELGASIVRKDTVTEHFAASFATKSGSRAMVLEKTLDFEPGEFSVVAVARDAGRGDIWSARLEADWPSPAKTTAAIAPVAVLQHGQATMSKDGALSSSGSLARDVDETIDPRASISLETVVCRGAKAKGPVVVERWLEDGLPNEFVPVTIETTGNPCVRTVDVPGAGRLRQGVVDYRVTARVGDEIVAQERRTLRLGARP